MVNIETILNQLPDSWETFTMEMFMKTSKSTINEDSNDILAGIENSLEVVSKITNIPVEELEQLSMFDIQKIGKQLDFMTKPFNPDELSTIDWKTLEEITYDNYIQFLQVSEDTLANLNVFIKSFAKNMTDDQINRLNIKDVISGFFLLKSYVRQYLKRSIRQEKKRIKQLQKAHLQKIKPLSGFRY